MLAILFFCSVFLLNSTKHQHARRELCLHSLEGLAAGCECQQGKTSNYGCDQIVTDFNCGFFSFGKVVYCLLQNLSNSFGERVSLFFIDTSSALSRSMHFDHHAVNFSDWKPLSIPFFWSQGKKWNSADTRYMEQGEVLRVRKWVENTLPPFFLTTSSPFPLHLSFLS